MWRMHDFTELRVWRRARRLAETAYRTTRSFPKSERYRLADQIRRCAMSVGANIAEGAGRPTDRDFARFVGVAMGSLNEREHHYFLALDLEMITSEELADLRREIKATRAMATGLTSYLTGATSEFQVGRRRT